jgi:hypothetical protein
MAERTCAVIQALEGWNCFSPAHARSLGEVKLIRLKGTFVAILSGDIIYID